MSTSTTLHIFTQINALTEALSFIDAHDEVLLLQETSYLSHQQHFANALIARLPNYYFLAEDLQARGIKHPISSHRIVDIGGMVELTEKHDKSITW